MSVIVKQARERVMSSVDARLSECKGQRGETTGRPSRSESREGDNKHEGIVLRLRRCCK